MVRPALGTPPVRLAARIVGAAALPLMLAGFSIERVPVVPLDHAPAAIETPRFKPDAFDQKLTRFPFTEAETAARASLLEHFPVGSDLRRLTDQFEADGETYGGRCQQRPEPDFENYIYCEHWHAYSPEPQSGVVNWHFNIVYEGDPKRIKEVRSFQITVWPRR